MQYLTDILQKLLRENLVDAKFISGPLTKLQWSKWILAATDKRPLGYSNAQFPRSKYSGWGHAFIKQNLFDKSSPSIYEAGVKFPDVSKRKIYVMYFKPVYYMSWRTKKINALTLVKTSSENEVKAAATYLHNDLAWGWKRRNTYGLRSGKKINALTLVKTSNERKTIANLVKNKLKIFFRRGSGTENEVKEATTYLHKGFDYAWGWKRRNGSRKVVKNGVNLS